MTSTALPTGRFSRLLLKVNAFLLLALFIAVGFLGLVAYKQGWFVKQAVLRFVTPNALGLAKGMPVKLHGFTVGSVEEMKLAEGGVEVHLSIVAAHLDRIPEDSVARHARESGLIGAAVIDIVPGKSGRPITEEARIGFEPPRGISEIVDDFRRQAIPAFNEVKQAMTQVTRAGEDVTQILAGLRREIEQLPDTHRAVRKLVQDASRATTDLGKHTVDTLHAAERMGEGIERVAGTLEQAVPMLSKKLASGLESIDAAAAQLKKTGEEAQLMLKSARPVMEQGETAAREAGDVLSAAKRVWPLSVSFQESSDGMLPIDSFDAQAKPLPR